MINPLLIPVVGLPMVALLIYLVNRIAGKGEAEAQLNVIGARGEKS